MAENDAGKQEHYFYGSDLGVLPEECIADVITFTSPGDACRLATVSRKFRSAADSDFVWQSFLPSDYQAVIDRADDCVSVALSYLPKKTLYYHLADQPILIDGASKSFWLDKWSGKKCYGIAARSLDIAWADTGHYWRWTSAEGSRFSEVADLIDVWWLEIRGRIKAALLSMETNYAVYLVYKLRKGSFGFYDSAEASVGIEGGTTETRNVCLGPDEVFDWNHNVGRPDAMFDFDWNHNVDEMFDWNHNVGARRAPSSSAGGEDNLCFPKPRSDGWMELEIGEFSTHENEAEEIGFSVMETKGRSSKRGLIVEGIEIRPKAAA